MDPDYRLAASAPAPQALASARRWIVLAAAVVVAALTARLGWWQLDRAAQKTALSEQRVARAQAETVLTPQLPDARAGSEAIAALHGRTARLQGQWRAESTVFLENRQMQGRPGFYVVTALMLEGRRDALLVQRGWVPRDVNDRLLLPAVETPTGPVLVEGRLAPLPARLYDLGGSGAGRIRQNLDLEPFSAELKLPLIPMSLIQTRPSPAGTEASDGLQRDWPEPAAEVHKHHGYAFQWFALSALTVVLYVWFQVLRPRRRR
jgi:surfeit locus 1 family protein